MPSIKTWAAAASVLLALITAAYFFTRKNPAPAVVNNIPAKDTGAPLQKDSLVKMAPAFVAADSLFAVYYKRPPVLAGYPLVLAAALNDYQNNRLESIERFNIAQQPVLRGESDTKEVAAIAHFYKGIVALEKEDPLNAVRHFKEVVTATANVPLREQANWYVSLAYLKMHDTSNASAYLQLLQSSEIYRLKSAQLRSLIKN